MSLDNVGNLWDLDNTDGIPLDMRTLESWPAYYAARDTLFGTHWLSRFWMQRVYWRIRPQRYAELLATWESVRRAMRAQFYDAVMKAGLEKSE